MVIQRKLYTVDEFEQFIALPENSDRRFELVNGEMVEKLPTEEHGAIAVRLILRIGGLVEQNDLGRLAVEPRHRTLEDDYNARIPDIAFTSKERALPLVKKGAVPQMPDLAIEIKSPDDSYKQMREKKDYYLTNGVRMVWLVFPEKRLIEVYTLDDEWILTDGDMLDGGDVLLGFTMPVSSVFDV
jgi:Uma2 family endonuclease